MFFTLYYIFKIYNNQTNIIYILNLKEDLQEKKLFKHLEMKKN